MNRQRIARFNQRITAALTAGEAEQFQQLIERYQREHDVPAVTIAAALASLLQGKTPLLLGGQQGDPEQAEAALPRRLHEPVQPSAEFEARPAPARPKRKEQGARARRRAARAAARAAEARKCLPADLVSRGVLASAGYHER